MLSHEGGPVWPVFTQDDLGSLQRIVDLCGSTLREVPADPAPAPSDTGCGGGVVVLREEHRGMGELYAWLTGRRFLGMNENQAYHPDVVVTTMDLLTVALLEQLYAPFPECNAPGIVAGVDVPNLRRQVLLSAAAARLRGPLRLRATEYYPLFGVPAASGNDWQLAGAGTTAAEAAALLSGGAGVLSIITHGDGVDAHLAPGLRTCPMDRVPVSIGPRATYCVETGFCYRSQLPVSSFVASPAHLSPDAFSCRVLVWGTCHGVLSADGPLDSTGGLLPRFLENPAVGAVVTTWGLRHLEPSLIQPLVRAIAGGTSLGDAVGALNADPRMIRVGARLCLFGDPEMALPRASDVTGRPELYQCTATYPLSNEDWGDLAFLRAYLTQATTRAVGELQKLAVEALRAVHQYEFAAVRGAETEEGDRSPGPVLRAAVLRFVHRRGPVPSLDWSVLCREGTPAPGSPCPSCGIPLTSTRYAFWEPAAPARRLSICPRCDIVEDAPVSSDLALRLEAGAAVLTGSLPQHAWTGMLLLACQDDAASVAVPWPAADRRPACALRPRRDLWPPGAVKATLVLMIRTRLLLLQAPGRRPPPCP
jgi:hypothetical protein